MMEGQKTIVPSAPIQFNGGEYSELKLREFSLGEFIQARNAPGPTAEWIKLISAVSKWPEKAVEMLGASDFEAVKAFFKVFMQQAEPGDWTEAAPEIQLSTPVKFGDKEFWSLPLREYTVGEKRKSETHAGAHKQWAQLISFVSGWPLPAVEMLPITKYWMARDYLEGFTRAGPATGENSGSLS